MADSTKIIIDLESRLRNLERTLKGLDAIKKKLDAVGRAGGTQQSQRSIVNAQRLALQQQKLNVQTQELANRQERARQTTERLAQSQQRLAQSQERVAKATARVRLGPQQDAQVKAFRALEVERKRVAAAQKKFDDKFAADSRARQKAAESLQRQRSAALIQQFRDQERETERAKKSILSLDQQLGRVGGSLRNLGLGLTSLGASLSVALTAPLTALGVLSTRNAVTLDSLNRGLTAIVGSANEAGRQLSRLTEIAKLPGIGFQEAIQGSIRLQAVGFSAGVAERALIQFSNAVALTGGGREELARITVQLGQLSAKGKVLAQDLKPIIEAGPAVGRALLQAFGTVNSEDIQALGLTSQQFIDRLLTQLEQLPRAAAGARNTFDNFSDAVFRASAAIGSAILPVLTRLIEVAEPIITRLAEGFKQLPPVVQTLIIAFAGLGAAAGPSLFIIGQFATGIGGLVSAFGRLHALGLLPTIAGFRTLTLVVRGNTAALTAQQIAAAGAAASLIGLGIAVAAVAALGIGLALLANRQKDAIKISNEQIAATEAQITTLKEQVAFLDTLKDGVERTANEQERLAEIYGTLNTQAKIRLTAITDEEKRLAALREELNAHLQLRRSEQIQQAASLATSLTATAQRIKATQAERDAIVTQVQVNTRLAQSIARTGRLTAQQAKQLERLGLGPGATATQALFALNAQNERLIDSQTALIKTSKELNGTAEEQGQALKVLQQQTGLSARELLNAAKAMGLFKGNVEDALPGIERFIADQERAAVATDAFTASLRQQNIELLKAGDAAENAAKQRNETIKAAVGLAKEATDSFSGALKTLQAFIAANPDLRAAIEKERQLAGKSFEEFIEDALGRGRRGGGTGTSIRNAQEQLASALVEIAEAGGQKLREVERLKNEQLLQANENAFRLQLIAYRQYLTERARLSSANVGLEITEQRQVIRKLQAEEQRALERAARRGIKPAERTRAQADAAEAAAKRIEAETELLRLQQDQRNVRIELDQAIAEAQIQQRKDVTQLEIEYGELRGEIEAALNAATAERFRETLTALSKEQENLNKRLALARLERDADAVAEIENAQRLNQSQIDLIESITQQELATNQLAAANEFVRRAKERQSELEQQIAFDVEFRGLKEEEAIRRRLEGERKVADSLRVVRDLIQAQIDKLNAQAVPVPQALLDFIRETNAAVRGLGELPFSEQFRIAEQEFNRINDERIRKIQDVERAVRNRTIAEVEGQIIIRRINKEYTADLEAQLLVLKQIAEQSNNEGLKRQAADAGETVKDTKDQVADLGKQIEAAGKDAFRSGLTDFFNDILNRTASAKEALLDLLRSITTQINNVIAENLSEKLFESLFGGAEGTGEGLIAKVRKFFGGGADNAATAAAGAAKTVETTAAATALTTGATAAAAALTTGGATAATALVTGMAASVTSFAAAVVAAGAAFAATVASASAAQAVGGLGGAVGAASGLFPAIPGGMYRIVEGGYPEAVITTDPKHAARQVGILRELIQRTKGFYGRIPTPDFALGGFVSRETAEANLLSSINRASSFTPRLSDAQLETAAGASAMNLRIMNMVSSREIVRPYTSSEEFTQDVMNVISRNSNEVVRRLPRR